MSAPSGIPNVESSARELASSFASAWNQHDAKALASHFSEDGDLISPDGRVANGRAEIENLFRNDHSSMFKTSRMSQNVERVRALTPDIAIATNRCHVTGAQNPATGESIEHNVIATFVLKNERGTWRIVSARPMIPVTPPR